MMAWNLNNWIINDPRGRGNYRESFLGLVFLILLLTAVWMNLVPWIGRINDSSNGRVLLSEAKNMEHPGHLQDSNPTNQFQYSSQAALKYPPPSIHAARPWITFKTENFTAPNISIKTTGERITPGMFFCGPVSSNVTYSAPMILDNNGELVWRGPNGISSNVKVQTIQGVPRLIFWKSHGDRRTGVDQGEVDILDSCYRQVYKMCPKGLKFFNKDLRDYECNLDMHVASITDRGTLIATAYNLTRADLTEYGGLADSWVYDSQFLEIDIETNQILYHWKSLEHLSDLPFSESKIPFNPTHITKEQLESNHTIGRQSAWDYFHINMVVPFEGGYIVSSKGFWSVLKVSQRGDLDWKLQGETGGDFTLAKDTYFSWQHDVQVIRHIDRTLEISMFNNDYYPTDNWVNISRGLIISLDLNKWRAEAVRVQLDSNDRIFSSHMGSSQLLVENHVLISYGSTGAFKEFDENDNLVMDAHFGWPTFQSLSTPYNVFRFDGWHAEPSTSPKVVAEYSEAKNLSMVWMSWNGATEYDGWVVHGGRDRSKLLPLDILDRTGFETRSSFYGKYRWFQVEARQNNSTLRKSTAVEARAFASS